MKSDVETGVTLDAGTVKRLSRQADLFNRRWKALAQHPMQSPLRQASADLMRDMKSQAQVLLLEFTGPDLVWVRSDPDDPSLFLVGIVGAPREHACHIPLITLHEQLSDDALERWALPRHDNSGD